MFSQRTIIDQIEIRRDGTIQLRLDKQLLKDGAVIQGQKWHRALYEPGFQFDFDDYCEAVNHNLADMGEAPVEAGEWDRVRRVIAMEHTPDVVVVHLEKQLAAAEQKLAEASGDMAVAQQAAVDSLKARIAELKTQQEHT